MGSGHNGVIPMPSAVRRWLFDIHLVLYLARGWTNLFDVGLLPHIEGLLTHQPPYWWEPQIPVSQKSALREF